MLLLDMRAFSGSSNNLVRSQLAFIFEESESGFLRVQLGTLSPERIPTLPTYNPGDYVKIEFNDDVTKESEWMWLEVEHSDDEKRLIFGTLDSHPISCFESLRLGQHLAVSYDLVREHRQF